MLSVSFVPRVLIDSCSCAFDASLGTNGVLGEFLLGGRGVIDALKLEERGVWVGVSLASLVGQVLALDVYCKVRVLAYFS